MDIQQHDCSVSDVAAAIAVPARTKMLCSLMDGHARTSTELAVIAGISPSTASEHLAHLKDTALVRLQPQGRHRYYSLASEGVARTLESLMLVGHGRPRAPSFSPTTPDRLLFARTCYDHLAGTLAVQIHDGFIASGWLAPAAPGAMDYRITQEGGRGLQQWGIDVCAPELVTGRRRLAFGCMDWSMRRPHLAGALGAALLKTAFARGWVNQDLDSRALTLTPYGRQDIARRLGIDLDPACPA